MNKTIWTVGHSTRTIDEFIALLKNYDIEGIVDVRSIPRSRNNPQFNKDNLEKVMPDAGIEYVHEKELGGLRHPSKTSINTGWKNKSFQGYADYMRTSAFSHALNKLIMYAQQKRVAIMCAEILPWRCHRSLISDALIIKGFKVVEIFEIEKFRLHKLTPFATIEDERLIYRIPMTTDDTNTK
jgi:uncharacterized protein (DUF488 family)